MLKAKKAFMVGGREFVYGDTVPRELLIESRIPALVENGLLEDIPAEEQKTSVKVEKQVIKKYSEEGLAKLKKNELRNIAESLGIETRDLTAQGIVNEILKQQ